MSNTPPDPKFPVITLRVKWSGEPMSQSTPLLFFAPELAAHMIPCVVQESSAEQCKLMLLAIRAGGPAGLVKDMQVVLHDHGRNVVASGQIEEVSQ